MFVQVVQAKAKDKDGLRTMFDRWDSEVKPAAKGYLGATGGVTDDGTFIVVARFESAEAAAQNNDIPEQQNWFSEFEKYVDDLGFTDYTNTQMDQGGGSDDAGFVQVIRIKGGDIEKFQALDDEIRDDLRRLRPDVIGSITAWEGDDVTQTIYFTSEAEARKNESNPEFQEIAKRFMEAGGEPTFYDLTDPWLMSA